MKELPAAINPLCLECGHALCNSIENSMECMHPEYEEGSDRCPVDDGLDVINEKLGAG